MIIVSPCEFDDLGGKDTLLALHVTQYRRRFSYLEQLDRSETADRNRQLILHAAQLCEMSRDLIYRLNRVSVVLVLDIVAAFRESVQALQAFDVSDADVASMLNSYTSHICKRIEVLEREIKAATINSPSLVGSKP